MCRHLWTSPRVTVSFRIGVSVRKLGFGVVSGATAAGLLQCSVGWHFKALAIGDERCRTARFCVIKVRPHHTTFTSITLAESSMADRLQAGCSGLQMSSWPGTV